MKKEVGKLYEKTDNFLRNRSSKYVLIPFPFQSCALNFFIKSSLEIWSFIFQLVLTSILASTVHVTTPVLPRYKPTVIQSAYLYWFGSFEETSFSVHLFIFVLWAHFFTFLLLRYPIDYEWYHLRNSKYNFTTWRLDTMI